MDTFEVLLRIAHEDECQAESQRSNFLYPIAGRIGVGEIVSTYWDVKGLTTFNPNDSPEGAAFSDKLIFKTKLSAGIEPSVTISTGSTSLRLTDVSLDGNFIREDIHQLRIALATKEPKKDPRKPNSAASDKGANLSANVKSTAPLRSERYDSFDSGTDSSAVGSVVRQLNLQRDRDEDARALRGLRGLTD